MITAVAGKGLARHLPRLIWKLLLSLSPPTQPATSTGGPSAARGAHRPAGRAAAFGLGS